VLDYAARLLPYIAPELGRPRSLRPGRDALDVRRVPCLGPAAVEAARGALGRPGSIGLIVPDAAAGAHAAALEEARLEHAVLGPGSAGARLAVVPASLAKGMEYDHVIVADPAAVAAGPRGLARLYVALTRAVSSLTVLHRDDLPAELAG